MPERHLQKCSFTDSFLVWLSSLHITYFWGSVYKFAALALQWQWLKETFINWRSCSLLFEWLNRTSFSWSKGKNSAFAGTQGLLRSSLIHIPPKSVMCISLAHLQIGQMSCAFHCILSCFIPDRHEIETEILYSARWKPRGYKLQAMWKCNIGYSPALGDSHWKELEPYQPVDHQIISTSHHTKHIILFPLDYKHLCEEFCIVVSVNVTRQGL